MRVVPIARSLSLALAFALAIGLPGMPAVADSDDPSEAVVALMEALDAGRFDEIGDLECTAWRDQAARRLDLADVMRDAPVTVRSAFLRLLDVSVRRLDVQILEVDGDHAIAGVTATIAASLDESGLRRALRAASWSGGIVGDAIRRSVLEQRIHDQLAAVPSPAFIDSEVELVHEDGAWKVCGDIGWGLDALDPRDVCGLLSPAELAILVAIPFSERTAEGSGCTYAASDDAGQLSTVNVRLEEGDLDLVRSTFADGTSVTVEGFDAFAAAGSLWVDLGGHLLTIQPTLIGAPSDTDPGMLAQAIAEVIVPRIGR